MAEEKREVKIHGLFGVHVCLEHQLFIQEEIQQRGHDSRATPRRSGQSHAGQGKEIVQQPIAQGIHHRAGKGAAGSVA